MEICKAPTPRLKSPKKHSVTHIMYSLFLTHIMYMLSESCIHNCIVEPVAHTVLKYNIVLCTAKLLGWSKSFKLNHWFRC